MSTIKNSTDLDILITTINLVVTNIYSLTDFLNHIATNTYQPNVFYAGSPEWRTAPPPRGTIRLDSKLSVSRFKRRLNGLESHIAKYRTALNSARFNTHENIKSDYSDYLKSAEEYLVGLRKCKLVVGRKTRV